MQSLFRLFMYAARAGDDRLMFRRGLQWQQEQRQRNRVHDPTALPEPTPVPKRLWAVAQFLRWWLTDTDCRVPTQLGQSGGRPTASALSRNPQRAHVQHPGLYGNLCRTLDPGVNALRPRQRVRTRQVICQNQTGATVADSNCPQPKPPLKKPATRTPARCDVQLQMTPGACVMLTARWRTPRPIRSCVNAMTAPPSPTASVRLKNPTPPVSAARPSVRRK